MEQFEKSIYDIIKRKCDECMYNICIIFNLIFSIEQVQIHFREDVVALEVGYVLIIRILVGLSLLIFLLAITAFVYLVKWQNSRDLKRELLKKVFIPFVFSIFFLRMSTVLFLREPSDWNLWESITEGIVRTLLTFNVDEANLNMLVSIKKMCDGVFASHAAASIVAGYSALLNVIAPITGGVIIFDILCDIFPRMKLKLQFARKKYVFSAINDKTVYLAESISEFERTRKDREVKKSALIFMNAHFSNDDENSAELLRRVKELGGICIKEDLSLFRIPGNAEVTYILQNEDDLTNINMLTELVDTEDNSERHYKKLCRKLVEHNRACEQESEKHALTILIFSQDDYADDIVKGVYSANRGGMAPNLEEDFVFIKVVREYTNLVYQLLWKVPLYSVLKIDSGSPEGRAPEVVSNQRISILIIGLGDVGREMLIAGYWCGQFGYVAGEHKIKKFPLEIHVVDKYASTKKRQLEKDFPGINFGHASDHESDYCDFFFYDCDVTTKPFTDLFSQTKELANVNYVVISLGKDIDNLNAARTVQRELDMIALTCDHKFIINYVIKNENLNNSIKALHAGDTNQKMRVFGNIAQRYGMNNIFATELEKRAILIDNTHRELPDINVDEESGKIGFLNNEYQRRSSSAAAVHSKYKAFAVGIAKEKGDVAKEKIECNMDYLAWLEHQRWNAYMRGIGYETPTSGQFEKMETQKDMRLRLHGAICESGYGCGIGGVNDWEKNSDDNLDALDNLSLSMNAKRRKKYGAIYNALIQYDAFKRFGNEYMESIYSHSPMYYDKDKQDFKEKFDNFLKENRGAAENLKEDFKRQGINYDVNLMSSLLVPDDYKRYDYSQLKSITKILEREKNFPMGNI